MRNCTWFRPRHSCLDDYGLQTEKMPLPDYGHSNTEKKTHQDIVFEMAPEIVSDDDDAEIVNGKKVKRKRGKVRSNDWWEPTRLKSSLQVTTGKIGIDLERTLVINEEKDPNVWKRVVDPKLVKFDTKK